MSLDAIVLIVSGVGIVLLGLIVYLRNPKSQTSKRFTLLTLSIVIWMLANYLSEHAIETLFFTRLAFAGGVFAMMSLFNFVDNFPKANQRSTNLIKRIYYLTGFVLTPLIFTQWFIEHIDLSSAETVIHTSFLYVIYLAYALSSIALMISAMRTQKKHAVSATQKAQVQILILAVAITTTLVIIANLLIPLIFNNWSSSRYGPLFTLLFVGIIAYSIVKHGLFDIRTVVARSLAYILSLGLVTLVISLSIYGLSEAVKDTQISESVQSLIYVVVTLMLVLSYPALKKFFDRITNSLFYRDAYDAEQFIGQLNKEVVSDIEIYSLLRKVVSVIEKNLKVTYCAFATISHQGQIVLVSDDPDERQDLAKLDIKLLRDVNEHNQVVVTDYLEEENDIKLKTHLMELDLGAVVCLVSKKSNEPEQFSKVYMVLGLKKSGNPYTSQDVRVLGIISNSLALAIQNALRFEEISRFNITLQEKIDEATRELKRTNEKLRALDEAKDEFISMASHQLRTPLTSVKGYVSMVLEGDTGQIKANQRKLLQQAFDSSQRMVYLIADLLNVSRLRTGKFVIENKKTNLADVVAGEVEQLKETAAGKNIKLTLNKPTKLPEMMLDETKIRQVVMNFLDNALYYTPSGGEVTVSLKQQGDSIEYTVTDTGVGVPKKEQHHLFTKFYRAGNARKMRPDGTGLGLYMAQKVVVAQGGAIIFESEEGKGSTFGFRFPLKTNTAKPSKA